MDPFNLFSQFEETPVTPVSPTKDTHIPIYSQENTPVPQSTKQAENPFDQCSHTVTVSVAGKTICDECGTEIKCDIIQERDSKSFRDTRSISDGSRCFSHPIKVKTIRDEIRLLGFEEPVISEAARIYQKIATSTPFKNNRRRSVILACVFKAHKILKIDINLEYLLKVFDLKKTAAHNGIKLVSLKIKNYDTQRQFSTYITPQDFINELLSLWDTEPIHYENIHRLYKLIDAHSNIANRSRPKSIAAGVIYYYIQRTGRSITLRDFAQRCGMTETTISKLVKDIKTITEGK
jgi:transcription initiation factor TFIIIB Brf1 subunit/transcription initiation factor TFIIB